MPSNTRNSAQKNFAELGGRKMKGAYALVECHLMSNIVNGPDGGPNQLLPFDWGYIDYFVWPWAQNWEEHVGQG